MGQHAEDAVWYFRNRIGRGKHTVTITRCKFCRKRIEYVDDGGKTYLMESRNGRLEGHVCKMKRNAGF